MEGMGSTNKGIVKIIRKRQHRITIKPHGLGKTIKNRFAQHNIAGLTLSYLCLLAISTTTPFFFLIDITDYK